LSRLGVGVGPMSTAVTRACYHHVNIYRKGLAMRIFKITAVVWVDTDEPGACARDHVEHDLDSWILSWDEELLALTGVE